MIGLNRGLVSDPAAPFGGMKQSGIGREGAHEGMMEFMEAQYISVRVVSAQWTSRCLSSARPWRKATSTQWFKSTGDPIKPGDNLFEIETDKVSMEVPSTATGVLAEIRVPAGDVAPVVPSP